MVQAAEKTLPSVLRNVKRNADRMRDPLVATEFLRKLYALGTAGRGGDPGWEGLQKSMQKAWARSRYCEGPPCQGKSMAVAKERGDHDAIMRHVNRLAE